MGANFDFLKYFPVFLLNERRDALDDILGFIAESAKEIHLKAYEALYTHAPLRPDYTYRYELWKKLDIYSSGPIGFSGNYTDLYSVPEIQVNLIDNVVTYRQNEYYYIESGNIIGSGVSGFLPSGTYYAPLVLKQGYYFYNSWGKILGLAPELDSDDYLKKIRGLINVYFSAPTVMNFARLVNVVAGAEVALDSGTVTSVSGNYITIVYSSGSVRHTIPSGLNPIVSSGDNVIPFQPLSDVVTVHDHFVDYYWTRFITRDIVKDFIVDQNTPFETMQNRFRFNMYLINVNLNAIDHYPVLADREYMIPFLDRMNLPGIKYLYQLGTVNEEYISGIYDSGLGIYGTFDITPDLDYNFNLLTQQTFQNTGPYDKINEMVPALRMKIVVTSGSYSGIQDGFVDLNNLTWV